jgi:signal recognition particle subunit SRP54
MLEKLGQAIKKGIDKIAGAIFVDKKLIEEVVKDLQRALIESDVNVSLVKEISDSLKEIAANEKIKGVEKREQIVKLLHDKLLEMLGGEAKEIEIKKGKQQKIMLLGLYGSGKTTTTAKLANYYGKRGFKTCILGLDVWRPAASEQLEQLGKQHNIKVFVDKEEKNPEKIYKELQKNGIDVFYDDREDVSAGVKFADADLIGIPVRLVVSDKTKDKIEWKERNKEKTELLSLAEVTAFGFFN